MASKVATSSLSASLSDDEICGELLQPVLMAMLSDDENLGEPAQPIMVAPKRATSSVWATLSDDEDCGQVRCVVDPDIAHCLRDYQREGVEFMLECLLGGKPSIGHGCILADGMGLGKTLQAIAVAFSLIKANHRFGKQFCNKMLVMCPTSLVRNWQYEFAKWIGNKCRCDAFVRSGKKAFEEAWHTFADWPKPCIFIASYEAVRQNHVIVCELPIDMLICDEAHRLKNPHTSFARCVAQVQTIRRLFITGTPIQNNLAEFYSLANLCNPGALGTRSIFLGHCAGVIHCQAPDASSGQLSEISKQDLPYGEYAQRIKQFVLRRPADLNISLLPPKHVFIVFLTPTPEQISMYCECLSDLDSSSDQASSFECLRRLRMLLLHPNLVHKAHVRTDNCGVESSNKFLFTRALLETLWSPDYEDKVVIVSNSTATLALMLQLCKRREWPVHMLDGSTPISKRTVLVDEFNSFDRQRAFVLLLSAKAGGCGLNIVGANRLVMLDADWNPANDQQAMARVWRTGQTKPCFIYRLFTTGTIEDAILLRHIKKHRLSTVIHGSSCKSTLGCNVEALAFRDEIALRSTSSSTTVEYLEQVIASSASNYATTVSEDELHKWEQYPRGENVHDTALSSVVKTKDWIPQVGSVSFVLGFTMGSAKCNSAHGMSGVPPVAAHNCPPSSVSSFATKRKHASIHKPESKSLCDMARWYFHQLSSHQMNGFRSHIAMYGAKPLRLGTLCSGADPLPLVFRDLATACAQEGMDTFNVTHVMACEITPAKQRFILANHNSLQTFFRDIRDVGAAKAYCLIHKQEVEVPDCDVLVAGFSCKSASLMNADREQLCAALARGELEQGGTTGTTLGGLLSYVQCHTPSLVIMENVEGILRKTESGSPIAAIHKLFQDCGYTLHWAILNTRDYWLPQRRRRVWMWAVPAAVSPPPHIVTQSLRQMEFKEPIPIHEFLTASTDEIQRAHSRKPRTPARQGLKWPKRHRAVKAVWGISEADNVESEFLAHLTAREQDIVRCVTHMLKKKGALRGTSEMFIDISQSLGRTPIACGVCPCLCPNGRIWSISRARLSTGTEKLSLQGLYFDTEMLHSHGFSDRLLGDLAGNAFSASVCLAVCVALFASMGKDAET